MADVTDDEGLNWVAAIMGWLVPGLGHMWIGHVQRGIYAMVGVLGLFLGGLLLGGVGVVDRKDNSLWFMAQAGAGPVAFAADWVNTAWVKSGYVGEMLEAPTPMVPRSTGSKVSSLRSVTSVHEIAILYCSMAGLMNVVVLLDALVRPRYQAPLPRPAAVAP